MKALNLNNICEKLNIQKTNKEQIMIRNVTTNILDINNDTLVFHLDKNQDLDINKFMQLSNCYIITDQPILKDIVTIREYFLYCIDVDKAYSDFINYYRGLFHFPVIAVTGTCGKTTTKEMIKQILEKNYIVSSTYLSKNALRANHNYLMSIDDFTNYGVYETGLTNPGNIINSCNFFRPDIGVITNIGIDHLNGCKSIDSYIRAKGEMLAGLQYKGTLIINGDDKNIKKIDFTPYKGNIVTFGIKQNADFYASNISQGNNGMNFNLLHKNNVYEAYVPGIGEHNIYNALAALAVLYTLGLDLKDCITLLASYKHIKSHLEFRKGKNNSTIIDDTWSSNPTSMKAAFEAIKNIKKRKIAVLGKISYLGDFEKEQCKNIGKMLINYGIDVLVTKDYFSKLIGKWAIEYGMDPKNIIHCNSEEEMKNILDRLLNPNTVVLFKVSMLDKSMKNIINYCIQDY